MRFLKKKGNGTTVRKVVNDDKTVVYGVVGKVGDLLKEGLFSYCDYPCNDWAFIANNTSNVIFGESREDVTERIEED